MKQKGIVSIAIIGIVILFLIAVGGFGYYLIDKNKKQKEDNQNIQQNQELKIKNNQVGKNQEKNQKVYPDKMTDEEAKEYFHATEIVNNNLPKAITFWTEAYCPGMGIVYEYIIPEGFKLHRCVNYEQEKGTHGGCPTCAMVKISLKTTEYKEKEEKATFIDGDHNITYSREWDIASQELTDDIFYSNEKLIEYIIASYDLAGLELDQKIQRGKFDVMNNNDVVLINLISSLMERDYFYVIEKGEKYSVLSFIYSTHHIGTTIDVIPNYFINNGKPFFIAYNGNATTGGCVTINENMLLYRIYNGVPKEVFSFPRYLMEDEREFNRFVVELIESRFSTNGKNSYAHHIRKIHPSPKPPQLMEKLIRFFSKENELVFDPKVAGIPAVVHIRGARAQRVVHLLDVRLLPAELLVDRANERVLRLG